MGDNAAHQTRTLSQLFKFFVAILGPENKFYTLAIVYGLGISLLSLATPISVQMLINTVANTGLTPQLVVLSLTLFGLLLVASALNALRIHLMDFFARRFYARMVKEISLRAIYALNPFFEDNNNGALFNRYFDITIVKARLPELFVGGFTIVLQTVVGCVLVSFYHPLLLVFNLILALSIWIVWAIWGKRAIQSAMDLSHQKHATAGWLEGLAASNGFFKSARHIDDALRKTEAATAAYMEKHTIHFRHHFSQTLGFLFIYAAASAVLLGLGGWLVIQGQLSLGQLVAAELVLSVVFVGLTQLGTYLSYFYDLCAAIDELSLFYDIEQEPLSGDLTELAGDSSLEFHRARGEARGLDLVLDFKVKSGMRVFAQADSHAAQRILTNLLKRHELAVSGYVSVAGVDLASLPAHQIRQEIIVLDRPNVVQSTIRELLRFSAESDANEKILPVLQAVGLDEAIEQLSGGLDARLSATGWPLSISEVMHLKLAAAILARPRVLILNELFDVMPAENMLKSLDLLQSLGCTTVVYFSNKRSDLHFDSFLYLAHGQQQVFDHYEEFCIATGKPVSAMIPAEGSAPPAVDREL
ncbi:MAG: ABC-type bacteriocin/lantibiotic exporter with double-glycine peptidase domain [Halieaceae bacterium]|jgi:putative ABC transport system ATP-binding protein